MTRISFDCPHCGINIQAPETSAGRRARCPGCHAVVVVPQAAGAATEASIDSSRVTGRAADTTESPTEERGSRQSPKRASSRERRQMSAETVATDTPMSAIALAVGAALVGTAVWAGIAIFAGREIGWVAWGIGALVGAACVAGSGRGQVLAITAASIAVLAILGGKYVSAHVLVDRAIDRVVESQYTEKRYETARSAWTDFAKLPQHADDDQLGDFMLEHDINATVEEFRAEIMPAISAIARNPPTLVRWRAQGREEISGRVSTFEAFKGSFGMYDILFIILGCVTAFGLVMKASDADAEVVRASVRARRRAPDSEGDDSASATSTPAATRRTSIAERRRGRRDRSA